MDPEKYSQAFQSFMRRENAPATLSSEEWSNIPSEIRERSFFMSKVAEAEVLGFYRSQIDAVLRGEIGEGEAEKRIHMWLQKRGYKPPEGKAGGLQDLSSLARINVVIRTNVAMARGHAQWVRKQTAIRAFPCQEFKRISPRQEPRDWDRTWSEAKKALAHIPGVHPILKIALLNHPIWVAISRFGNPYPPFDFGSGMGVESVSRTEALKLGFKLDPNNDPMQQPIHKSMNEGLESDKVPDDIRDQKSLEKSLGRLGKLENGKVVFTDPDGTKPYTAAELAELWSLPAPEGYERLTQKEAIDSWNGGTTEDAKDARVKLRQLFERIPPEPVNDEMIRQIEIGEDQLAVVLKMLDSKSISIPGNVAGWSWAKAADQVEELITSIENGWTVILRLAGGQTLRDLSAIRPGKPGFVSVAGTEFKVIGRTKDDATRTLTIDLSEQ